MRRVLTLVLLAVAMPARSATVVEVFKSDPPLEVKRLVDAELKFAKLALDTNIRDAFNENMATDAILFRPTPVNAKEFFGQIKKLVVAGNIDRAIKLCEASDYPVLQLVKSGLTHANITPFAAHSWHSPSAHTAPSG